jgi:peptidoglycan/LPS O-acetylase OafA/YrhL
LLIANGLYVHLGFSSVNSAIFGLILALTVSLAAATLFYRWIESPAASRSITTALSRVFNLMLRATAVLFAFLVPQRKP